MKMLKRMLVAVLVACSLVLVAPVVTPLLSDAYTVEAATVKISNSKIYLGVGSKYKLKVTGTSKTVKWSSSNKSVAKVSSTGYVTAVKKGTATITAKVGTKKYKCTVKVTKNPVLTYRITTAKKSGNYYIIEGRVFNKTKTDLDYAYVEFNLYDKNNEKITYTNDSTYWIDDAGTWRFYCKAYVGTQTVKSYKNVELSGTYYDAYDAETKFEKTVSMKTVSRNTNTKTYKITGTIKNKNGQKVDHVFATYAFYDKEGRVVATRFCGYYDGYKNGTSVKFEESATIESALGAVKCKVVEAHSWY